MKLEGNTLWLHRAALKTIGRYACKVFKNFGLNLQCASLYISLWLREICKVHERCSSQTCRCDRDLTVKAARLG